MSSGIKIAIVSFAVAVALAIAGAWSVVGRGFSAREEPTAVEAFAAARLRSLAIPGPARGVPNPVAASEETLSEAMAHFADHCAICHANDGSGETSIGRGLYPKPPDMRLPQTQDLSDGELYYIIHNGIRLTGMPAFGAETGQPDMDSWKLVHFIRYLPKLSDQELERMKGMNPKSAHEIEEEEAARRFLEGDDSPPPASGHGHD
jgi:mono/diheme cytochrome c family protein